MTTLWVSYKGKKYVKVAKYEDIVPAIGEMLKYVQQHIIVGDKVKLVYSLRE